MEEKLHVPRLVDIRDAFVDNKILSEFQCIGCHEIWNTKNVQPRNCPTCGCTSYRILRLRGVEL